MEFRLDEILTVIDKVKSTDLAMFEYQDADTRICIKGTKKKDPVRHSAARNRACAKETAGADAGEYFSADSRSEAESGDAEQDGYLVTSPMVGTFYAAPAEKEEPFVHVGDKVRKGQTIGIIEAMKLMNEIETERDGVVAKILVTDGQMVEYGQPLIRLTE